MEMSTFRERYPPPWRAEETPSGYQVVSSNGMSLLYIYAEVNDRPHVNTRPGLSRAEAKALALRIAALPDR